jgi:hypothetical protein
MLDVLADRLGCSREFLRQFQIGPLVIAGGAVADPESCQDVDVFVLRDDRDAWLSALSCLEQEGALLSWNPGNPEYRDLTVAQADLFRLPIQVVLTQAATVNELLLSFDLDYVQAALWNGQVFTGPHFERSRQERRLRVFRPGKLRLRRFVKAANKGFRSPVICDSTNLTEAPSVRTTCLELQVTALPPWTQEQPALLRFEDWSVVGLKTRACKWNDETPNATVQNFLLEDDKGNSLESRCVSAEVDNWRAFGKFPVLDRRACRGPLPPKFVGVLEAILHLAQTPELAKATFYLVAVHELWQPMQFRRRRMEAQLVRTSPAAKLGRFARSLGSDPMAVLYLKTSRALLNVHENEHDCDAIMAQLKAELWTTWRLTVPEHSPGFVAACRLLSSLYDRHFGAEVYVTPPASKPDPPSLPKPKPSQLQPAGPVLPFDAVLFSVRFQFGFRVHEFRLTTTCWVVHVTEGPALRLHLPFQDFKSALAVFMHDLLETATACSEARVFVLNHNTTAFTSSEWVRPEGVSLERELWGVVNQLFPSHLRPVFSMSTCCAGLEFDSCWNKVLKF